MTASRGRSIAKARPAEGVGARADGRRHHPDSLERAVAFSHMQCASGNLVQRHPSAFHLLFRGNEQRMMRWSGNVQSDTMVVKASP
jgi:hypothetical protein